MPRPTRRLHAGLITRLTEYALGATIERTECLPCQLAAEQGVGQFSPDAVAARYAEIADPPGSPETGGPERSSTPAQVRWSGVIGVEGEMTGDGRLIEPNALRWDLADGQTLPLRYVSSDVGAHDGAVVVGGIDTITRKPDGVIWGSGPLDAGSPSGQEAIRVIGENLCNGVSMDLDDVSFEVRIAAELMEDTGDEEPTLLEIPLATQTQTQTHGWAPVDDEDEKPEPAMPEPDKDGRIKVLEMKSDDEVRVTTDGRIRAATIVAIPAFARAQIHLDADTEETGDVETTPKAASGSPAAAESAAAAALAASGVSAARTALAAPVRPPRGWFAAPALTEPTPLTITPEGRIYGHIAEWGTCHISHTAPGQCVQPPHSVADYAYFRTGAVLCDDGTEVAVGHLTIDARHAGEHLTPASAVNHYENTGNTVGDVAAGEDTWGIWIAGALRPYASAKDVRALRSAPVSGDWREIRGNLELVAALGVNVPGFPVPRPRGLVAGGRLRTLLAAGMLAPKRVIAPSDPASFLSSDDLKYLKMLAARERTEHRAAVTARVRGFALRRRIDKALALVPKA